MPNPKLTEASPFLQDEVAFATPERETEYGVSGLASPFLSDELLQTFTPGDRDAWSEPESETESPERLIATFTARTLPVKTTVLVTQAARQAARVDVLFFAHGLDVCGPVLKNRPTTFVTERPFRLGDLVEASGRPIVLVVPFLDWEHLGPNKMAFGNKWHKVAKPENLNGLVAEALAQAAGLTGATTTPAVQRLIVAGHSRAFGVFDALARAHADAEMANGALGRLSHVWALDSTYTSPIDDWKAWLRSREDFTVTVVYRHGKYRPRNSETLLPLTTGVHGSRFQALAAKSGGRLSVVPVPSGKVGHCAIPGAYLPDLLQSLSSAVANEIDEEELPLDGEGEGEEEYDVEMEAEVDESEIVEEEEELEEEEVEDDEETEDSYLESESPDQELDSGVAGLPGVPELFVQEDEERDFDELEAEEEALDEEEWEQAEELEDEESTEEEGEPDDEYLPLPEAAVVGDNELFEGQTGGATPPRYLMLVAGLEFPKFGKEKVRLAGKSGTWWKLSHGTKALAGTWRNECLGVARLRLKKDPDLIVCLYDFFTATLELVKLVGGKLETTISRQFTPLVHGDYRWLDGDTANPDTLLKAIPVKPLPVAKYPTRPIVRYCPSVGTMPGEPKQGAWITKFHKSGWDAHGLSIRHVYEHIQQIGAKHPYSLQEFHSFGHASGGTYAVLNGPAFVNTTHVGTLAGPRHPLDLDARAGLDFQPATMNLKNFRMAFAKGAMSYVWGCNWDVPLYRMLQSIRRSLGTKALTDERKFKFPWKGEKKQFDELVKRAACTGVTWKSGTPPTVEMDGKCLRAMLTMVLKDTYAQHLANASGRCVTAALPGTWSDHDSKAEKGAPKLSHVPMGNLYCTPSTEDCCCKGRDRGCTKSKEGCCCDTYLDVMRFYAKHLGSTFNQEGAHPDFGRGYAVYCPET